MMTTLLILLSLLLVLHAYREYWRLRSLPQVYRAEFTGQLMKVGSTYIARRPAINHCPRTIVCFPGFLEDMRYFQALYKDEEAELILVNNANYHCPFVKGGEIKEGEKDFSFPLTWPDNPYQQGTIEHDAFYLGLVVERLARGREVCVHGHSRGGAVVLEAGRQYPLLMRSDKRPVRAILEGPVLPQARIAGIGSDPLPHRIMTYFLPIFFGFMRNVSAERLLKNPMMRPTNELKTQLCLSIFCTSRRYATCVTNVQSIYQWQRDRGYEVYDTYPEITVVVGQRDSSLSRSSMLESAANGKKRNDGVSILKTTGTNHFISLEQPETIRAIH